MKERLVEDWLTKINERGYEIPFSQSLIAQGYVVIRCGHSPTEHGKDIIAVSPDGTVYAYQLKTGDLGQAELGKYHDQLVMLVETRPSHPALPATFEYRPMLVTTGEFKGPAVSRINELNSGWEQRNHPKLTVINGRKLHVDFLRLSADFWPQEPPSVRRLMELYLAEGRGDFSPKMFAEFLSDVLSPARSGVDLSRRTTAVNLFASYLLGPFYGKKDHWSIFQAWTICAAQIVRIGLSGDFADREWHPAFNLAKDAGIDALRSLSAETLSEKALRMYDREIDAYTRARNTVALAGVSCLCLLKIVREQEPYSGMPRVLEILEDFERRKRVLFWGEGALSQFLMFVWVFDSAGKSALANKLLVNLIREIAGQNGADSSNPLSDPYCGPDECLERMFRSDANVAERRMAVQSYSLNPLLVLAVRRQLRSELEDIWPQISRVQVTWFKPATRIDGLRWHCSEGKEFAGSFDRPQSWSQLQEMALKEDTELLNPVFRSAPDFCLMFLLAFPHRMLLSAIKYVDGLFTSSRSST